MSKKPTYIPLYFDKMRLLKECFSNEDIGIILMALYDYAENDNLLTMSEENKHYYPTYKELVNQVNRDFEKYDNKCKKASANISKRWNTKEYNGIRTNTEHTNTKTKTKTKTNTKTNNNIYSPAKQDSPSFLSEFKEIVSYLNEKTKKNFKHSTKDTQKHINARLKEGYTVEDFKKVIDIKCREWLSDTKMSQYLRPATLFGTNFESYLNQATTTPTKKIYNENGGF